VNTAYRKTSLHRDKPNRSLRLASSPIPPPGPPTPTGASAPEGSKMTRIMIRRLGPIPSSRCQENRRLRIAAKRYSSCVWTRSSSPGSGGARRDRTDDLLLAKQALSQLSYGPVSSLAFQARNPNEQRPTTTWWAWKDLNFRPHAYQARALTN
jgi:hypothetical protein